MLCKVVNLDYEGCVRALKAAVQRVGMGCWIRHWWAIILVVNSN
jgi:hypothetical protein